MPFSSLVFSLTVPGCNITIESYPAHSPFCSFPYDVTLAFLKGATTVEELSNVCEEKRTAGDYINAIKKVLGNVVGE